MTTTTTSTKPVTEANAPERGTLHERTSHALTALTALRDHLRVQIHLGGMDARATWDQTVAPKLLVLTERLADARAHMGDGGLLPEDVKLRLHLGAMDAREEWRQLEAHIEPIIDRVRAGSKALGSAARGGRGAWDEAKGAIAAIAEIDAPAGMRSAVVASLDDETRQRAERMRAQLSAAGHSFDVAARDAVGEIGDAARRLRERLEPTGTEAAG